MKFKKFLLVALVTVLTVAMLAGTALAGQGNGKNNKWNNGKGKSVQVKNVQVKKVEIKFDAKKNKGRFSDVSEKHWGNKRIRAMVLQGVINGYANGLFCPNASVSKIEAVTMILRMDNVDKEDLKEALEENDVPRSVPAWAKGYAALAVEEGILTEDELKDFRPNQAAKRYEVAIYLGRYLDIVAEDEDLDFKDEKSIPKEARKYLPYLVEKGYMTGYKNGKFMPNKPVTRAEIACILSKITDDKAKDDDVDVEIIDKFKAKGKIKDLDDETLVLKTTGGSVKEFSVDPDDIIVFLDNKEADYDDLEEGYSALVLCNSDNEALVIYAHSTDNNKDDDEDEEDDVDEVEGVFRKIDGDEIKVKVGNKLKEYDLADDVDVEIDNKNADLDDLLPGMKVELVLEDDEVVEISADSLDEISGEFVKQNGKKIVIEIDGENYTCVLADDVEVEIDGDEEDLDDLEKGMEVELSFDDGEVVEIEAYSQ